MTVIAESIEIAEEAKDEPISKTIAKNIKNTQEGQLKPIKMPTETVELEHNAERAQKIQKEKEISDE